MSAKLAEELELRENLCMQYRTSYFNAISLCGSTMRVIVVNHCNQRDAKLAAEAQKAIDAHTADEDHGGKKVNIRLKTLLELQTILCTEYRNAYFTIISLAGAGIFNFVRDHHHQHDGVLEAEAARMDDMVDRIRFVAEE